MVSGCGLVVENLSPQAFFRRRSGIGEGTGTELCLGDGYSGIKISYSTPPIVRAIEHGSRILSMKDFVFDEDKYVSCKETDIFKLLEKTHREVTLFYSLDTVLGDKKARIGEWIDRKASKRIRSFIVLCVEDDHIPIVQLDGGEEIKKISSDGNICVETTGRTIIIPSNVSVI